MVLTVILFAVGVAMRLTVSFSLVPATASGLRSTMPVRTATIGRPFRSRTTTARGTSTSIRVATTRAAISATSGSLFGLSKGSPNSERM